MRKEKKFIIGSSSNTALLKNNDIMEIINENDDETRILMGVPLSTSNKRENEDESEQMNNAYLLSIHEHGTIDGRIPPRPLLSSIIKQEKSYLNQGFNEYIRLLSNNENDNAEKHLEKMAIYLEGRLVEYFTNNNWKPNAPSTIAKKGSARPLIDTGDLRRAIRAFVYKGGNT